MGQMHDLQGFQHRLRRFGRFALEVGNQLFNTPGTGGEQFADGVGVKNGMIQFVVQFAEDRDQTLLAGRLLFGIEGFAGAQFFQDIVHPGQGQRRVLRLLTFAVRVELFSQITDAVGDFGGSIREREGFKAAGFVVARTTFQRSTRC
jgi:hypothetical protein